MDKKNSTFMPFFQFFSHGHKKGDAKEHPRMEKDGAEGRT
jgi:hypothetical protein